MICCQHPWDVTPKQAIALQKDLRSKVVCEDRFGKITYIAGVDVGFDKTSNTGRAAIAVLEYAGLSVCERVAVEGRLDFPYVPGLLSFREMPLVLRALGKLKSKPDIIICDGQGIAHPRRFGIACHLGIVTNIPCIGAAKSRLCGTHGDIPAQKGGWTRLCDGDEVIGAVLRTRENVKPLFVSPGHKVSLLSSIEMVMHCVTRYKLPETTRQAHNLSLFKRT